MAFFIFLKRQWLFGRRKWQSGRLEAVLFNFSSKFSSFRHISEVSLDRKHIKFVGIFIFVIENRMAFFLFTIISRDFRKNANKNEYFNPFSDKSHKFH